MADDQLRQPAPSEEREANSEGTPEANGRPERPAQADAKPRRRSATRGRTPRPEASPSDADTGPNASESQSERTARPGERSAPPPRSEEPSRPREGQPGQEGGQGNAEGHGEGRRRDRNRNRRKKDKKRDNRGETREHRDNGGHPGEPFEGMLELIGDKKFGFIRAVSTSLIKGDNDPFMPPPLIQKYNLRDGVVLKGLIKPGRKGAWQVTRVDEVMGMDPEAWKETPEFDDGLVIYPDEKLDLVSGPADVSMRVVDLVAPLGKGQRALIVAPPRAGKTVMLKQIAAGLQQNHPEVKLIALLIDERPEEVTDFRRNTAASVFASSNDYGEDNHIRVATLAFEYARRLVEQGHDVVMLLDSLTRLGRTFNIWGGNSGRTMSGGLDARALLMPRKIFGSARNIEHGGSFTIIATALIETGSRMDDVIFEEFKGTGNAEIVLDRELADKRIYPAINVRKSGTRNEERLMSDEQMRQRTMLFRVLNERHPVEAMQALAKQVQRSPTNVHLLNELIPEQTY